MTIYFKDCGTMNYILVINKIIDFCKLKLLYLKQCKNKLNFIIYSWDNSSNL